MSSSSSLTLPLSLMTSLIFGYALYYLNFDSRATGMHKLLTPELLKYGNLKWLTYQCLVFQFVSSVLHLLSCFSRIFESSRDAIYTTLAYPCGSIVVYSFWGVWFLMGRELIFPKALDPFYPFWLNQTTHTIIVPINFLLAYLVHHKAPKNGYLYTLFHLVFYVSLLYYIKFESGHFVYKYLETFGDAERMVYFAATGIFALIMYASGLLLTRLIHGSAGSQRPASRKQKQK